MINPVLPLLGLLLAVAVPPTLAGAGTFPAGKVARIHSDTPLPRRFQAVGHALRDRTRPGPVFLRGIGYSPYRPGETAQHGDGPGDDDRYAGDLALIRELGANYLQVFPLRMPAGFFTALDATELVYGQDIWIDPFAEDLLDEGYQTRTLAAIRAVIDHTYQVGRPERLVLFSVGDELQAATLLRTDRRHPAVRDYQGRHLSVSGRTPSEVALARLIDQAMSYELERYGQRHLYCHTSWTHVGPVPRPDLEVPAAHVLDPDLGDLRCLNIYTYARGVVSSAPGSVTGTPYQGYLEALARDRSRPILITQVGWSSSPQQPRPDLPEYGGQEPAASAARLRAVWRDLRSARGREVFAGLAVFEFHDEWWKNGWAPGDEQGHEPGDPEEWFGLYGLDQAGMPRPKGQLPATLRTLFTEAAEGGP
jgi:hypothetical protein